jgi:hypothetical protein
LIATIASLRADGEIVIEALAAELPGAAAALELDCDRQLVKRDGEWKVEAL